MLPAKQVVPRVDARTCRAYIRILQPQRQGLASLTLLKDVQLVHDLACVPYVPYVPYVIARPFRALGAGAICSGRGRRGR